MIPISIHFKIKNEIEIHLFFKFNAAIIMLMIVSVKRRKMEKMNV